MEIRQKFFDRNLEWRKVQYLRKKHLDKKLDGLFCNKCINNIECKSTDLNDAFEKKL